MIESDRIRKILYGGDYNPEQWPEEIWEEDMRLLKQAHIDVVTINVFGWGHLQPSEDTYNFEKLDKIMDICRANGLKVVLGTGTACHPAWMARKYPDVLRVEHNGMKRKFGARHNSCPNSPSFNMFRDRLVRRVANRYKDYDNIVAWHVSNEYTGDCYCDNCEKAFREWLKEKYGTIEELNRVWNLSFWGHNMYDFEDVVACNMLSEEFMWDGNVRTNFQGISLDYMRFNSDSMLNNYKAEKAILKEITPNIPVTTNFMGTYDKLDYFKWAKDMDFIAWDNYPNYDSYWTGVALQHDIMRGLKGGKPFSLMEQTPGVSNWHIFAKLKRPGVMRLLSYQAVAHGADTVMFFQMRRSIGACEKYHSAVIDHVGHENTRVFREISALGAELEKIGDLTLGGRFESKVAIYFDWDNWWGTKLSAGPSKLIDYISEICAYQHALASMNIPIDVIGVDDDLSKYKLVIAPMLYMCKGDYDQKIREYVENGGNFVTSYFSGYVDEHDLVVTGGYPGRLSDILGIWVEESDAIIEGESNSFKYKNKTYPATVMCDFLHTKGAKTLATYDSDFYAGMPVITENEFGKGHAYYIGTHAGDDFYINILGEICGGSGIEPVANTPQMVEACMRVNDKGRFLFLLNHGENYETVVSEYSGTDILSGRVYAKGDIIVLEKKDVCILHIKE